MSDSLPKISSEQLEQILEPLTVALTKVLQLVGHSQEEAKDQAITLRESIFQIGLSYVIAGLPEDNKNQVMTMMQDKKPFPEIIEIMAEHSNPAEFNQSIQDAAQDVMATYFEEIDSELSQDQKQAISVLLTGVEIMVKPNNDHVS